MRAFIRGGCIALTTAAFVVSLTGAAGAAPKPKAQSPAKYAKTMCGIYAKFDSDFSNYDTAIRNVDPTDPAAFKTQMASLTAPIQAELKAGQVKLAAAYPDVSSGKKIGALLSTNFGNTNQALASALSTLQADTTVAGPTTFLVAIHALPTKLSGPFRKITDQTVINAVQKEKSCKTVVTVTGG